MLTQEDVDRERTELKKRRKELLKAQQSLSKRLKLADRQRRKRQNVIVPAPLNFKDRVYEITPKSRFICKHELPLPPDFQNSCFIHQTYPSRGSTYRPLTYPSRLVVTCLSRVHLVDTLTWACRSWEVGQVDQVVVLADSLVLFVSLSCGVIYDVNRKVVYREPGQLCAVDADRLNGLVFVSSAVDGGSSVIRTLELCKQSRELRPKHSFTAPQVITSLKHYSDRLLGLSHCDINIWRFSSGEVLCSLSLPECVMTSCHVIRRYQDNTFISISSRDKLYAIVLSEKLDKQKLVCEFETQGNVFVSGFYCVYVRGDSLVVYNMVTEGEVARVDVAGYKLVSVAVDQPVFVLTKNNKLYLYQFTCE